ncbi:MAG: type 4a pilus biogenesis protein PilO [Frankia sp.]|nr:type 4a pilus biogenesis protein PilO [Frankia sp.]
MDKLRQQILLTVLVIVAILAAGWFLLVTPKKNDVARVRAEVTTQEQANRVLQSDIQRLREQAKGLPAQQARLAEIIRRIPGNPALPALIRAMSDAAGAAGVDLVSLAPGPAVLVAAPAAPVVAPTAGAVGLGGSPTAGGLALAQIPVSFVVTGGYFQIEQFFSNVEALQRSMIVGSVTLAPGGTSGSANALRTALTASVGGRVFMTAAAPAPPPAATPAPEATS